MHRTAKGNGLCTSLSGVFPDVLSRGDAWIHPIYRSGAGGLFCSGHPLCRRPHGRCGSDECGQVCRHAAYPDFLDRHDMGVLQPTDSLATILVLHGHHAGLAATVATAFRHCLYPTGRDTHPCGVLHLGGAGNTHPLLFLHRPVCRGFCGFLLRSRLHHAKRDGAPPALAYQRTAGTGRRPARCRL